MTGARIPVTEARRKLWRSFWLRFLLIVFLPNVAIGQLIGFSVHPSNPGLAVSVGMGGPVAVTLLYAFIIWPPQRRKWDESIHALVQAERQRRIDQLMGRDDETS